MSISESIAKLKALMRERGQLDEELEVRLQSIVRSHCFTAPEMVPQIWYRLSSLIADNFPDGHPNAAEYAQLACP